MGCCQSSEPDEPFESEREPLLGSGRVSGAETPNPLHSEHSGGQQSSDEQSALSRIQARITNDLIDISAQAHCADLTEENEQQLKSKQYAAKLNRVVISVDPVLGSGRLNPFNVLSAPAIPLSDLDLVSEAAQKTTQCMSKVVIHPKEDLVVPFGVP